MSFIVSILVGTLAFAGKDPQCKATGGLTLNEHLMTPIGLRSYIEKNRSTLKDIGDVICCLPESYRKNFVLIHSSLSAQSSDVHRPRALLFNSIDSRDILKMGDQLNMVLSFNGGGEDLTNSDNLEILFHNKQSKRLELYDLELSENRPKMSGANPPQCIQCHGTQGELNRFGVKPIFEEVDQWTRVVNGLHACGAEIELQREIVKTTRASIGSNPRYRCLDEKALKEYLKEDQSLPPSILTFDLTLRMQNAQRVAKYIKSTRDYDKFKYATLGAILCFPGTGRMITDATEPENADLSGWIPAAALKEMNQTDSISKEVLSAPDLQSLVEQSLRSSFERMMFFDQQHQRATKAFQKGQRPQFDFYRGSLSRCQDEDEASREKQRLKKSLAGPKTLDYFKVDSALRGFRGSQFSPFLRYLFEARGIRLDDAAMDALPGQYPVSPGVEAFILMELEPPGSELRQMADLARSPSKRPVLCQRLKELSLQAFGGNTPMHRDTPSEKGIR